MANASSQILALRDALASDNGPAITNAFAIVARSRGLAAIATEAGIPLSALHAALADPDRPNIAMLSAIVEVLIDHRGKPGRTTL